MNKEQFTTILQVDLFNFDGCSEIEIMKLYPSYDLRLIKTGINLCNYLKEMNIK